MNSAGRVEGHHPHGFGEVPFLEVDGVEVLGNGESRINEGRDLIGRMVLVTYRRTSQDGSSISGTTAGRVIELDSTFGRLAIQRDRVVTQFPGQGEITEVREIAEVFSGVSTPRAYVDPSRNVAWNRSAYISEPHAPAPESRPVEENRESRLPMILMRAQRDPYSVAANFPEAKDPTAASQSIIELGRIQAIRTREEQARALSAWIRSPEHAVFVYQNMGEFREHAPYLMRYLRLNNPHFKGAQPIDGGEGGFITFGWDIEQPGPRFALLYRPVNVTEADWGKRSDEDRLQTILGYGFDSFDRLAPTSLAPAYLGKMSKESNGALEVKHRAFELSPRRALAEIREVASLKGNNHSIHVHIVFDIPREGQNFGRFLRWRQQMDWFLMWRGLEEGLAPTSMTFGYEKNDAPIWDKLATLGLYTQDDGSFNSAQFGKPPTDKYQREVLQLRDSTRNLNELDHQVMTLTQMVRSRVWERKKAGEVLDSAMVSKVGYLPKVARTAFPEELRVAYDMVAGQKLTTISKELVPLVEWENMAYPDYVNNRLVRLSPNDPRREAIQKARLKYLTSISRQREQIEEARHGTRADQDALEAMVNLELVEFARATHLQEFFPEYKTFGPSKK